MNATAASTDMGGALHPSPHRDRVGIGALAFGLVGGPFAWSVQVLVNSALSSYSCFPKDVPLQAPTWAGLEPTLLAIELAALVVCIVAAIVAWRSWRRSSAERPGSAHHLVESGDGRTRFLAMAGLMTSVLFFVAILFAMINLATVPLCGG